MSKILRVDFNKSFFDTIAQSIPCYSCLVPFPNPTYFARDIINFDQAARYCPCNSDKNTRLTLAENVVSPAEWVLPDGYNFHTPFMIYHIENWSSTINLLGQYMGKVLLDISPLLTNPCMHFNLDIQDITFEESTHFHLWVIGINPTSLVYDLCDEFCCCDCIPCVET